MNTTVFVAYKPRWAAAEHEFFERMDVMFSNELLPKPRGWDANPDMQLHKFRRRAKPLTETDELEA